MKHLQTQLQTPAISADTAESGPATGHGGSYAMVDGKPVLTHRTVGASVSRKAPLTDAAGNPVPSADPLSDASTGH